MWHADGLTKLLRDELLLRRDVDDFRHVDWLYTAGARTPQPV